MYATIRRYKGVTTSAEELTRVGRQLASLLSQVPGFVSHVMVDAGAGMLATVSIFDDEADLQVAGRLIAGWLAEHQVLLLPLLPHPTESTTGEVVVQKGL